jgi:hypothetical protein
MNRRQFLSSVGTSSVAAIAAGSVPGAAAAADSSGSNGPAATPAGPLLKGTPVLYAPTETSATAVWALNRPACGWIEYGPTPDLGLKLSSDPMGFVPHSDRVIKLRLQGLKPGTRYWWRVVNAPLQGGPPELSAVHSFKTLDSSCSTTNFAVWSDTHDHADTISRLQQLTNADPPDFLVWNGDLSNNVETPEAIPGLYVCPGKTDLSAGPPVLLTRGNHDVRGLWANRVSEYVDFPAGRSFYAFRSGPLAAVILDTGEDKPDRHPTFRGMAAFEPLIEEQARWLAQIIQLPAFKSAPYRLAFCHIPLRLKVEGPLDYDQGGYDLYSRRGREAWHGALVQWGAQAILSGHLHSWAYLAATADFPYAQVVGGGPALEQAVLIRGKASATGLKLVILDVNGKELHSANFLPKAG